MLVIPAPDGFLLQLARDLAPAVAKRLSMFVLRSKVKIADESEAGRNTASGKACRRPVHGTAAPSACGVGERRYLSSAKG